MAIRCPGCGREYDVTLFQFGRTIRCACGERVGVEASIPLRADGAGEAPGEDAREAAGGRPRFIVDSMLGRLARWLRTLGFDAAYEPSFDDEELVRRAFREGRLLLTRDRDLVEEWWLEGVLLLESDDPLEQLRRVARRFGLAAAARPFTRCTVCNEPLEPVPPGAVEGRIGEDVPERVARETDDVRRCPSCGKLYWEGSHTRRMRARLDEALGGDRPPG